MPSGRPSSGSPTDGGPRPALTPLGRSAELKRLSDALVQAKDGLGSLLLLLGPSGIGKTSVLERVGELGRELGFELRRGFAIEGWTSPFFLLEQLLPSSEAVEPPADPAPSSGAPSLMALAGARSGDEGEEEDSPVEDGPMGGGLPLSPEGLLPLGFSATVRPSAKLPEANALLGFFHRLEAGTRRSPQLLLVDDLQWGDVPSLQGLRFLTRNARHLPAVIVATARWEGSAAGGGGADRDMALAGLVDEAQRADGGSVLRLGPLAAGPAFRLAESVLGGPLATPRDARPFRALLERSQGNPLLLREMLREMQGSGLARKDRNRWTLTVPSGWEAGSEEESTVAGGVPPALAKVVLSRVAGLPLPAREALRAAAVLGSRFDLAAVAGALGRPPSEVLRDLAPLAAADGGLLTKIEGPSPAFAFAHSLLFHALSLDMPLEERREIARRLAEWLSSHRPGEVGPLARLYREAGASEPALRWTRRAIDLALATNDAEGLERLLRDWVELDAARGVGASSSVKERFELAQRMVRSLGPNAAGHRILTRLLEESPPGPQRWEVLERLAWIDIVRAPKEGRAELERLTREVELAKGSGEVSPVFRGMLELTWTNLLIREGKVPEALARAQGALRLLEGTKERWDLGRAYYCAGWCFAFHERQAEAQAALAEALAIARELDDPRLLGLALELQGMLANLRGAVQEARNATVAALEQYRRAGSMNNVVITLGNLANVEADLGEMDLAWGRTEEMAALARRFDLKRGGALAVQRQGDILAQAHRPEEARERFHQALELFQEIGDRESVALSTVRLARMEAETGRAETALRLVEEVERGLHGALSPADRYLAEWARSVALAAGEPPQAVRASFEHAREEAHDARNPYSEAEVVSAQADWEARTGTSPSVVRALRTAAEQLWKSSGVDPRNLLRARTWTGPKAAVGGAAAKPPRRTDRRTPSSGGARAPLAQRILEHIARQQGAGGASHERAPEALTQGGLSRALALPQARFAKTLTRLEERGLVASEVRPVEGHGRRLKVYRATPSGLAVAREYAQGPAS